MTNELTLNFFDEIAAINLPNDLSSLRIQIADLYQFSLEDAKEIIIYYILNNDKIIISSEEDYKNFILTNINQIHLEISQKSQIYQQNFNIINEEITKDKNKLEELLKKHKEFLEESQNKFNDEKKQIQEISEKIFELENQKKQITYKIISGYKLLEKEIFETEKQIVELQKKLKMPISYDLEENSQLYILNKKCQKNKKWINYLKKNKNKKIDDDIKEITNWTENVFGKIIKITSNIADKCKIIDNLKYPFQNGLEKKSKYEPIFHTGLNYTTEIYNISKYPLPKNFEVLLYFDSVVWVRTGITFDKNIINDKTDENWPQYDIYYLLEDLQQFYSLKDKWKSLFKNKSVTLKNGSYMTMSMRNGKLKYKIDEVELEGFIEVDLKNKGDMYLLIHERNSHSKCSIISISELID